MFWYHLFISLLLLLFEVYESECASWSCFIITGIPKHSWTNYSYNIWANQSYLFCLWSDRLEIFLYAMDIILMLDYQYPVSHFKAFSFFILSINVYFFFFFFFFCFFYLCTFLWHTIQIWMQICDWENPNLDCNIIFPPNLKIGFLSFFNFFLSFFAWILILYL